MLLLRVYPWFTVFLYLEKNLPNPNPAKLKWTVIALVEINGNGTTVCTQI